MQSRLRRLAACTAAVALLLVAGASGSASAATTLPARVYAPYFETWTTDSIATLAQQSGSKYFTLAFLESLNKRSCTLAWNGSSSQTVAAGRYLSDIAALRSTGGDVVLSLGGWSADQGGTEIADSCGDPQQIAAAYESAITTYNVSRLDMDVEGRSLDQTRRHRSPEQGDQAGGGLGRGACTAAADQLHDPHLRLGAGVERRRHSPECDRKRRSHRRRQHHGVRLLRPRHHPDGAAAENAATGTVAQLHQLYPNTTPAQLWAMVGITIMPGIDDYPKKTEVTTVADAQNLVAFAKTHGVNTCRSGRSSVTTAAVQETVVPTTAPASPQNTWDFSHAMEPFTG